MVKIYFGTYINTPITLRTINVHSHSVISCNWSFELRTLPSLPQIIVSLLYIEVMQISLSWFSLLGLGLEMSFIPFISFACYFFVWKKMMNLKRTRFYCFRSLILLFIVIVRNEEVQGWFLHEFTTQTAQRVF